MEIYCLFYCIPGNGCRSRTGNRFSLGWHGFFGSRWRKMMAEHFTIHVLLFCWWRLIRKSETKLIVSIHLNCSPLHVLLFLQKLKFNFQQFRLHTVYEKINLTLLGQNGIWMKFLAFIWFIICTYVCHNLFFWKSLYAQTMSSLLLNFKQKPYTLWSKSMSLKKVPTWRSFKNIFSRPLLITTKIFISDPYSILTM